MWCVVYNQVPYKEGERARPRKRTVAGEAEVFLFCKPKRRKNGAECKDCGTGKYAIGK
jgi:hypothetical protein